MTESYKLIDVGRNTLTSIPNININAVQNIMTNDTHKHTLIAEYGICVPEQENQNIQMSGSFGINVPFCSNGTVRIMTTIINKISEEKVTYFMNYSLNNNSYFPKYKLINFNALLDNIDFYGYQTHRLYIISNVSIALLGPVTFQGLLYAIDKKITYKICANDLTINKIVSDNSSSTIIPFSSGDNITFSNEHIYLTSYGNYILLKHRNVLDTELEIEEPYGSFCVPRKTVLSGISCKFIYKGFDPYYPLNHIKIKINIYVNNPKKDNVFKKLSEHTLAEFDHGDCINFGQLSSIIDNDINHIIDEGSRILPIFSIKYNDTINKIIGQYHGSISLK